MTKDMIINMVKILLRNSEGKLISEIPEGSKSYLEGYRDACKMMLEHLEKK